MSDPYRSSQRPPPDEGVRCMFCGTLHPVETPYCGCGVHLADVTEDDDGAELFCPRCHAELVTTELDPNRYGRHCTSCGGIFVNPRSWTEMIARTSTIDVAMIDSTDAPPLSEARLFPLVKCPRCGREMERARFAVSSGVLVDVCMMHGIWFDAGELFRAVDWLHRRQEARPTAETEERVDPWALRQITLETLWENPGLNGSVLYEKLSEMGHHLRLKR